MLTALCNFARLALTAHPLAKDHYWSGSGRKALRWRELAGRRRAAWAAAAHASLLLRVALTALSCGVAAQAEPPYALIGQNAPDFALHAAAGGNARLSEHRGEVVVVSFWSSRCTPCRTQLAALNRSLDHLSLRRTGDVRHRCRR